MWSPRLAGDLLAGPLKTRYGRPRVRRGCGVPAGLIATDVSLPSLDGTTLRGWFCRSERAAGRAAGAVVLHGWGGSAADMAPIVGPLAEAGIHTLLLDARCHGRSDDADFTSMPRFAEDVQAGVRWLRDQPLVDPERVLLVGHSVGAGACLLAARDDARIVAVVSLSSMADPREMMARLLADGHVPRRCIPPSLRVIEHVIGSRFADFAPLTTVATLARPLLLVHGADDAVVPVEDVHRLARAAGEATVLVLPGAGHAEPGDTALLGDALREFLRRAVGGHTRDQGAGD